MVRWARIRLKLHLWLFEKSKAYRTLRELAVRSGIPDVRQFIGKLSVTDISALRGLVKAYETAVIISRAINAISHFLEEISDRVGTAIGKLRNTYSFHTPPTLRAAM